MADGTGTALATAPEEVAGVHHAIETVNGHLKTLEQRAHLVAPATRVGSLPPGCGVALAVVRVSPSECFKINGKLVLPRNALDRIGAAAGVSWDPAASGRTDDGSRLYVWSYRAVGHYRQYDGSLVTIQNEYEFDVSDGSPRAQEAKDARDLRTMRKFGLGRAVTGARLRALADIGIRRAYEQGELERPFVVAKVHFDGQTSDPEERRIFAATTAAAMLGGTQSLYGRPPATALPPPAAAEDLPEGYTTPGEALDAEPEPEPAPTFVIPGGKAKGTPIGDADDSALRYWLGETEDDELRQAIQDQLDYRAHVAAQEAKL